MFGIENAILAQICGFIALTITLIAFLQKEDTHVKKLMIVAVFFWGIHYMLLWIITWVMIIALWYVRLILSVKYNKNIRAFIFIVALTLVSTYFTYEGIMSLLPVIASLSSAYAFFYLEKIKLRLTFIWGSFLWLVYNIHVWTISGILNEVMVMSVLSFTIYRMAHPEWGMKYYSQKIADILLQKSKPDYDRFIFVRDKVSSLRKTLWHTCLKILHYDLRNFLPKRNSLSWKKLWVK